MTEPREALQPDERELARLNHSGTHSCRGLCPGRFLVALEAAEARLAAGVHLGDEGLDALLVALREIASIAGAGAANAPLGQEAFRVIAFKARAALATPEDPTDD